MFGIMCTVKSGLRMQEKRAARDLPELIVIGARKCGTTWLDECMREHPGVELPRRAKEIFFFDRFYHRGLDWYARQFVRRGAQWYGRRTRVGVRMEVSPSYLASPVAAERMAKTVPGVKLVVLLRNPIDRTWSDMKHAWRKGKINPQHGVQSSLEGAPGIVWEGMYAKHIARWVECFGWEQLRVFVVEEVVTDPASFILEIQEWLGVESALPRGLHERAGSDGVARNYTVSRVAHAASRWLRGQGAHALVNSAKRVGGKRLVLRSKGDGELDGMPEEVRLMLRETYASEVRELEQLLGRELSGVWGV